MCRHIIIDGKKVYLVPFSEVDALKQKKGGAATAWAECDARSLSAVNIDLLGTKLRAADARQLKDAVDMADAFYKQLGFSNHGLIYCKVGCERTGIVAALLLRKHGGKSTDEAMTILRAAYANEPQFALEYQARPDSHLRAYDKSLK